MGLVYLTAVVEASKIVLSVYVRWFIITCTTCRTAVGIAYIQPLMTVIHSLRLESTLEQCPLCPQIGEQYSATGKQSHSADVRRVEMSAPQPKRVSLFNRLYGIKIFHEIIGRCCLNERV